MKAYIITPITIITVFILLKLPLFGSEQISVMAKEEMDKVLKSAGEIVL